MAFNSTCERLRSLIFFLIIFLVSACETTSTMLYDWGSYERDLYHTYKKASGQANAMRNLEALVLRLEAKNKIVAPGLYSEMGTFYLQSRRLDDAIVFYKKEREAWPESRKLMTKLIDSLNTMSDQPNNNVQEGR